jgi:hypothetical protein
MPRVTEENYENINQDIQCASQESNQAHANIQVPLNQPVGYKDIITWVLCLPRWLFLVNIIKIILSQEYF